MQAVHSSVANITVSLVFSVKYQARLVVLSGSVRRNTLWSCLQMQWFLKVHTEIDLLLPKHCVLRQDNLNMTSRLDPPLVVEHYIEAS